MKKIILLSLFLMALTQGTFAQENANKFSDMTQMMNKAELMGKEMLYKNKTQDCPVWAQQFKGEYSYKSLYDFCCLDTVFDYLKPPSDRDKIRIPQTDQKMYQAENECGVKPNKCLIDKLTEHKYRCNKLSTGEDIGWGN